MKTNKHILLLSYLLFIVTVSTYAVENQNSSTVTTAYAENHSNLTEVSKSKTTVDTNEAFDAKIDYVSRQEIVMTNATSSTEGMITKTDAFQQYLVNQNTFIKDFYNAYDKYSYIVPISQDV